jgi:hypothetical protein
MFPLGQQFQSNLHSLELGKDEIFKFYARDSAHFRGKPGPAQFPSRNACYDLFFQFFSGIDDFNVMVPPPFGD